MDAVEMARLYPDYGGATSGLVSDGTLVELRSKGGAVSIEPVSFHLQKTPGSSTTNQVVVMSGEHAGQAAAVIAQAGRFQARLPVQTIADPIPMPEGGFAFIPHVLWVGELPLEVALNTPHCQIHLAEIVLEQVDWVAKGLFSEGATNLITINDSTG
jgi:hypothetical protein